MKYKQSFKISLKVKNINKKISEVKHTDSRIAEDEEDGPGPVQSRSSPGRVQVQIQSSPGPVQSRWVNVRNKVKMVSSVCFHFCQTFLLCAWILKPSSVTRSM